MQLTTTEYSPCRGPSMGANDRLSGSCKAFLGQLSRSEHSHRVLLQNWPRLPLNDELPHLVRTLLRCGEGRVVLDLTGVATIDAAGIGELVQAYNVASAADGVLQIANTTSRVREMLERVGLFDVLHGRLG